MRIIRGCRTFFPQLTACHCDKSAPHSGQFVGAFGNDPRRS
jgi:hypothetical protein